MTSSKLRAGPNRRAVVPIPTAVASDASAATLPLDALHEIFLRLPGKDLCRLRAVCRAWRSFLSDPLFAAAHAARHPEPLIVAGYDEDTNNGVVFDIIDLAGHIVRRVKGTAAAGFERVMSTHLDLICVAEGASGPCRVLNPGTGVFWTLPEGLAVEHAAHEADFSHRRTSVVIGQVASTGECKVLRMIDCPPKKNLQLYEVVTLAVSGQHTRWRAKTAPPYTVTLGTWSSAVVNGYVYFFSNEIGREQDVAVAFHIGSFDLETEEWRPIIRGPLRSVLNDAARLRELSLAVLNGCLVVVHPTAHYYLNLWFLEDPEKGIWVMQNRMQVGMNDPVRTVRPLLVLNDGRIVLVHEGRHGSLKLHNPKTATSTDVAEIGRYAAIGLYTGNLLSLANGARS